MLRLKSDNFKSMWTPKFDGADTCNVNYVRTKFVESIYAQLDYRHLLILNWTVAVAPWVSALARKRKVGGLNPSHDKTIKQVSTAPLINSRN